jgi:hypothetical protein
VVFTPRLQAEHLISIHQHCNMRVHKKTADGGKGLKIRHKLAIVGIGFITVPHAGVMMGGHDLDAFQLAYHQSKGFFDDITNNNWKILQQIARDRAVSVKESYKKLKNYQGKDLTFYDYFEPDFSCQFEKRMGNPELGDGPKWVCDPHRLTRLDKCLVYSIGSHGDFSFETSIQKGTGNGACKIHTFDPDPVYEKDAPSYVEYHSWGLASSSERSEKNRENFKSIEETVRELGHSGRIIDLFKIDCEGCEWNTFREWINSDLFEIRQILVEMHKQPSGNSHISGFDFFEELFDAGYVIFHKEANIDAFLLTKQPYYEYAFLKLDTEFRKFQV